MYNMIMTKHICIRFASRLPSPSEGLVHGLSPAECDAIVKSRSMCVAAHADDHDQH